jgi:hypothetical protein
MSSAKKDAKAFEIRKQSFQEMIPIKDILNGCFVSEHGRFFPVIKLGNINFDLMSEEERKKLVDTLKVTFGSFRFSSYQINIVPMPFDIDSWLHKRNERLDALKEEETRLKDRFSALTKLGDKLAYVVTDDLYFNRRNQETISDQIQYMTSKIIEGGMTSKSSFFTPIAPDNTNIKDVLEVANQVVSGFKGIGIEAKICSDLELRVLLQVLLNPKNAELIKPEVAKTLPVRDVYLKGGR